MRISIDTSLLAHASVESQRTPEAVRALDEIAASQHSMFGAPGIYAEFPSLLRRLVNQELLGFPEADAIHTWFNGLIIVPAAPSRALRERAWEIATRLGQSDTFDAMGYAVAEAVEGEFWTSDRRFTNAARAAGLERVRFVP